MYGPLEPAGVVDLFGLVVDHRRRDRVAPCSTKIFTADAGIRAFGATRRRIDRMLRWMSSTSVTAGPGLDHLADPALLVLLVADLDDAQKLFRAAVEVLLVARLGQREAFTQLAVDLGPKNRAQLLSSFMSGLRSGTRIRTLISSSKDCCPAIRRSPSRGDDSAKVLNALPMFLISLGA